MANVEDIPFIVEDRRMLSRVAGDRSEYAIARFQYIQSGVSGSRMILSLFFGIGGWRCGSAYVPFY